MGGTVGSAGERHLGFEGFEGFVAQRGGDLRVWWRSP
jgi:hypothetical protein